MGFLSDAMNWVLSLVDTLGYPGLAIVVALENLFPPIPSEAVLPLAGFLVFEGRMTLIGAIVASTVGSVVGALILYWVGYAAGEDRVRAFVKKYGRWFQVDEKDLDRSQEWFKRHGRSAVFFGRLAPLIRSIISVPAGMTKVPLGTFILYTTLGSGLWNALLIGAGMALGASWGLVEEYQSIFSKVVVAIMAIGLVWFFGRRFLSGHSRKQAAGAGSD